MIHAHSVSNQITLQYIANIRLPTEKAHGAQIMKTCEALAHAGARVTLLVSSRRTSVTEDPFVYYAVEPLFVIKKLPVADFIFLGRIGFWLESLSFSCMALWYTLWHRANVIYSRDELPLFFISFFKKNIMWESHGGRINFLMRRVLRVSKKIVVITNGIKSFYEKHNIIVKTLVAPDGIDLKAFANPESNEVARVRLGLPQGKKVALYIGRLDGWKGTDTLLEATALLPADILVAVIGGEANQIEKLKKQYPSVKFLGFRPYRELADNQAAADVLVLPNTGKDEVSAQFTSPMKLFSYMAAGKPIVASNLPSLREVLGEESALFFTPDDPHSLAEAIQKVYAEPERAHNLAARARADVVHYTWEERARSILAFV